MLLEKKEFAITEPGIDVNKLSNEELALLTKASRMRDSDCMIKWKNEP